MPSNQRVAAYWKKNIRLILLCLCIWVVVSFLCGIVFVEQLNTFRMGGYKLGFWFAHQGAIFSFLALIFFYNWRVGKLDDDYRKELDQGRGAE